MVEARSNRARPHARYHCGLKEVSSRRGGSRSRPGRYVFDWAAPAWRVTLGATRTKLQDALNGDSG